MYPNIVTATSNSWIDLTIKKLNGIIEKTLAERGECNLFLTGGKTAEILYKEWDLLRGELKGTVHVYWGDERYVPHEDVNSNFFLAQNSLLKDINFKNVILHPIPTAVHDIDEAALLYEKSIPSKIDLVLLSVGADAHIASLFPHSSVLEETNRLVKSAIGPNFPNDRITITKSVLEKSEEIVLMVTGKVKGAIVKKALSSNGDYQSYPVLLAQKGTWIFDQEASKEI